MTDPIASRYICGKDDIYALGTIIKHLNEIVCVVAVYDTNQFKYRALYKRLNDFITNTTKEEEKDRWDLNAIKVWFNELDIYKTLVNEGIYDECHKQLHSNNGGSQKAKRKTRKQTPRR